MPWLAKRGIPGHIEMTTYGPDAHSEKNLRRSACFRCSWQRRKRLFELCAQYGATHLALGHNADDLVQTFFMNLSRNGRVDGMSMNEPFFGGGLQLIRPMLLVEKKFILKAAKQWELPIWAGLPLGWQCRPQFNGKRWNIFMGYQDSRRCIFNGLTAGGKKRTARLRPRPMSSPCRTQMRVSSAAD